METEAATPAPVGSVTFNRSSPVFTWLKASPGQSDRQARQRKIQRILRYSFRAGFNFAASSIQRIRLDEFVQIAYGLDDLQIPPRQAGTGRLRSPDLLWNLVALTNLMRLSLREKRTRDL